VELSDLLESLRQGGSASVDETEDASGESRMDEAGVEEASRTEDSIHEMEASAVFGIDDQLAVPDVDKIRYVCAALNGVDQASQPNPPGAIGSAEVRDGRSVEPYILMSRGQEFADSLEVSFFAKTFPTLFPFGRGGPRQALEGSRETEEIESTQSGPRCNLTLAKWAKLVLQRHGGRFAVHPVFAFLVFNMELRSRNRRASMASVKRRNFAQVEAAIRSLDAAKLERARQELEETGKTTDPDVRLLLRSLSVYGHRQPMSRESRLLLRKKLVSLIVLLGLPAIWFTLNPNDLTNPVKLRLAAYRKHDKDQAEVLLRHLDRSHKRAQLAISDPLGSALFFHREVSMFFRHYVKTGEDSVFGRMREYFGAVETNERGSLHIHGLMWLHGNMGFDSLFRHGPGSAADQEAMAAYINSVFTEVRILAGGRWNVSGEEADGLGPGPGG